MIENFDDLFDKFFNRNDKDDAHIKKMRDLQDKLNKFDDVNGLFKNPHESELGEPDEVVRYTEGPYIFEKKTWDLGHGKMIKVDMVFSPLDSTDTTDIIDNMTDKIFGKDKLKRNLEKQLELAIEEERYEDAVWLRDKIKQKEVVEAKKETKKKQVI